MQKFSILIFIISSLLSLAFYRIYKKQYANIKFQKINIYTWMKMGRKKRCELDELDRINVMEKKNKLIARTRTEYLKYKKSTYK